ncbi:MAG TPA: winged helix-turn-helix domain-containing protein [Nannocystaceae bacterium]|nr:winged helix-turn-helix domain-containing protein [Nannocystaceae bacterium]
MSTDPTLVIADLVAKRLQKLEEVRRIETTIKMLSEMYSVDVVLSGVQDVNAAEQAAVMLRPDQFFGMSQTEAAAALLELRKKPFTVEEIVDGIVAGGCQVGGASPRNTVYTQLVRATHRFVKLPSGHFGLLDWYPEEKAKRRGGKKKLKKAKNGESEVFCADEADVVDEVDGHEDTDLAQDE